MGDMGVGEFLTAYGAYIAAGVAVAGSAVSTVASVQQGKTAKDTADYNAAAQNATAKSIQDKATQDAADQRLKTQRMVGTQIANAGAGGIDPNTGSPLEVESQTKEWGELDALRILKKASDDAWGYTTQAGITSYQGGQQQTAAYATAGSTLLGGASKAYYGLSQTTGGTPTPTPINTGTNYQ
jgi:hypothetical protein